MALTPFIDEAAALQIGGLAVENRLDRVSLHGSLDLTRDKAGLGRARALRQVLEAVVAALEAEGEALPAAVRTGEATDRVPNPFG
jgi:hypothetical protein